MVLEAPEASSRCGSRCSRKSGADHRDGVSCDCIPRLVAGFGRRPVSKAAVRPPGVVLPAPLLDEDTRLAQVGEPLAIEALAAQRAVEALDAAVLPRLARLDRRDLAVVGQRPDPERARDELRPVVAAQ